MAVGAGVHLLVTSDAAIRLERLRRLAVFERRFTALPVDEAVTASYGLWPAPRT